MNTRFLLFCLVLAATGTMFISQWRYHTKRYEALNNMLIKSIGWAYFTSCVESTNRAVQAVNDMLRQEGSKLVTIDQNKLFESCNEETITYLKPLVNLEKNKKSN